MTLRQKSLCWKHDQKSLRQKSLCWKHDRKSLRQKLKPIKMIKGQKVPLAFFPYWIRVKNVSNFNKVIILKSKGNIILSKVQFLLYRHPTKWQTTDFWINFIVFDEVNFDEVIIPPCKSWMQNSLKEIPFRRQLNGLRNTLSSTSI